jgi:hypothetical protein
MVGGSLAAAVGRKVKAHSSGSRVVARVLRLCSDEWMTVDSQGGTATHDDIPRDTFRHLKLWHDSKVCMYGMVCQCVWVHSMVGYVPLVPWYHIWYVPLVLEYHGTLCTMVLENVHVYCAL